MAVIIVLAAIGVIIIWAILVYNGLAALFAIGRLRFPTPQ